MKRRKDLRKNLSRASAIRPSAWGLGHHFQGRWPWLLELPGPWPYIQINPLA